mmetsp:Transcript_8002/g.24090  ORF Transcript_8002/g.24090 Transcript_8002/m.24090 type:complete len:82 (+) Transcript_8002:344-589(+)
MTHTPATANGNNTTDMITIPPSMIPALAVSQTHLLNGLLDLRFRDFLECRFSDPIARYPLQNQQKYRPQWLQFICLQPSIF